MQAEILAVLAKKYSSTLPSEELLQKKIDAYIANGRAYSDHYQKNKAVLDAQFKAELTLTPQVGVSATGLSINIKGVGSLLSFAIKGVESCCAMKFLYSFVVHNESYMPADMLKEILDIYFRSPTLEAQLTSNRLIINMVEHGRITTDPFVVVEDIDDPKIMYKPLWDYFHQYHKVNTMLMPNKNTGAIIHHMEVLFSDKFFAGIK